MRGLSDRQKGLPQQQYLCKIEYNVVNPQTLNDDIFCSYSGILMVSPVTAVKKTPKASMKVGSEAKVLSLYEGLKLSLAVSILQPV